ncbi:MAG: hypothetical protein P4L49_15640 [Desulfosporosinus sp.]|nr:hypothetical protein [Desulfosporosinus sp.]
MFDENFIKPNPLSILPDINCIKGPTREEHQVSTVPSCEFHTRDGIQLLDKETTTILLVQVVTTQPNQKVKLEATIPTLVNLNPAKTSTLFEVEYKLFRKAEGNVPQLLLFVPIYGNFKRAISFAANVYYFYPNITWVDTPLKGTYSYFITAYLSDYHIGFSSIWICKSALIATIYPSSS